MPTMDSLLRYGRPNIQSDKDAMGRMKEEEMIRNKEVGPTGIVDTPLTGSGETIEPNYTVNKASDRSGHHMSPEESVKRTHVNPHEDMMKDMAE